MKWLKDHAGAIVLSVVVTIVLAQLSKKFPKVSKVTGL